MATFRRATIPGATCFISGFVTLILFVLVANVAYADALDGYVGSWVGELNWRGKPRKIEVVLWSAGSGQLKGAVYYPVDDCAGRLRLDANKKGKLLFSEVIFTPGTCLSNGNHFVSLTPDQKLHWHWDSISNGDAKGLLDRHAVSATTQHYARGLQSGINAPIKQAHRTAGKNTETNSTAAATSAPQFTNRITSPAGHYLVSSSAIHKLSVASFSRELNRYEVNANLVQGSGPYFKIGERTGHAYWFVDSQQFKVSQFQKVPGLQQCNSWSTRFWTFIFRQDPNHQGVWKEVADHPKDRTPTSICKHIRIYPDSCKSTCTKSPPPPEPESYLVKDLAEAKSIYKRIAKPSDNKPVRQKNNARSSSEPDPWKEYWDQKVKDARDSALDY